MVTKSDKVRLFHNESWHLSRAVSQECHTRWTGVTQGTAVSESDFLKMLFISRKSLKRVDYS